MSQGALNSPCETTVNSAEEEEERDGSAYHQLLTTYRE